MPSLNALRAFEVAARHRSFMLAARELSVTPSAINHQVKSLEDYLRVPMFHRQANQLALTEAGARYLEHIRSAFDHIEKATHDLHARRSARTLTISTSPNFAAKWLVPRRGRFCTVHPGLNIDIRQSVELADFAGDAIDMAIRYGVGPWPNLRGHRLAPDYLLPVCAFVLQLKSNHGLTDQT